MKQKLSMFLMIALLLSAVIVAPMSVQAASKSSKAVSFPTGTLTGTTSTGLPVTLTNTTTTISKFAAQGGQVVANGTLTGTLVDSLGNVLGNFQTSFTGVPVTIPSSSCTILHLDLGPLHLTLLGLVVDLNAIHLDVTAVPGAGLLGDLLCAIDNLLNGAGNLNALSSLLNSVLNILSGL